MSPHESSFLKKPPLSNLFSNCSDSVSVTIKIIKQKTQKAKPVGLTPPWDSVLYFLLRRSLVAQPDVLSDGKVKEHGLLADHTDPPSQPTNVQVLHVDPIHFNSTCKRRGLINSVLYSHLTPDTGS